MKLTSILLVLCAVQPFFSQNKPAQKPTIPNLPDVNPQLLQLVIDDQWDRGNDMFGQSGPAAPREIDWKRVRERDEQRHAEVHKLVQANQLRSGRDFYFAAIIFQHSDKADDLMLGHVLAMTAVAKGYANAKWMAAATLDRYLNTIRQPQIFGTQFHCLKGAARTMDPYDRNVLSDSERALWDVAPLADQEQMLKNMQDGQGSRHNPTKDCR